MSREHTSKAPGRREKILSLLRTRGPIGATNRELNDIGFRYGGRLHELRRAGYQIRTVAESEGRFRFVLESEPDQLKPLPDYERRTRELESRAMPLFAGGRS